MPAKIRRNIALVEHYARGATMRETAAAFKISYTMARRVLHREARAIVRPARPYPRNSNQQRSNTEHTADNL
jgi:hypothetical protein